MKMIAAMSTNRVIGLDNKIPWHYSEDFKFFKEKTLNQNIVMGRSTFESVGLLPNREIFVLTHRRLPIDAVSLSKVKNCNLHIIDSLEEIPNDAWICGGSDLYEQTMNLCTHLYLTVIHKEVKGDRFMPWFEADFNLNDSKEITASDGVKLEFRKYINKFIFSFNPLKHEQTR